MKVTDSKWYPQQKLIATIINGDVDEEDISRWKYTLDQALAKIEDNGRFKNLRKSLRL